MTKALTLDEARDALYDTMSRYDIPNPVADAIEALIDAKIAIARQEIAALSDGDRTRAEDARVGPADHPRKPSRIAHDLGWLQGQLAKDFWCRGIALPITPDDHSLIDVMGEAIEALRSRDATIAGLRAQLDDDVVRLVLAARAVAFGDAVEAAIRELDAASEAFADRIPWDDEPAGRSALSQSKKG